MRLWTVIKAFLVFLTLALAACAHDDNYFDETFKKIEQQGG